MYECFIDPFQAKSEAIKELEQKMKQLERKNLEVLQQMDSMQEEYKRREQVTLDKFVNILNAKKEKLRQLRDKVEKKEPAEE